MADLFLNLAALGFAGLVVWVIVIRPAIRARRGEAVSPFDPEPAWSLALPGHRNSSAPPTGDLLAVLGDAQHLLIIGPSRSGKTSLVHELARRWRTQVSLVVLDPDAAPGLWPGCEVFGAGDDFAGIDTALHALQTELEERRRQRARGVRRFAPVRVIMSEAADLMANCAHARPVFAGILRRGAKLGISLVVDVQDRQRKTLDLDGQTHLLNNFDTQVDVRRQADHRRIAIVKRGEEALEYPIPQLPDLDQLQASTSLLEAPDRQTDRQTDLIATPETIDAVPSVCPGDRNAVIAVLLQNDWSTSQIRTVIKGDNNELSATIKRLKGDADAH